MVTPGCLSRDVYHNVVNSGAYQQDVITRDHLSTRSRICKLALVSCGYPQSFCSVTDQMVHVNGIVPGLQSELATLHQTKEALRRSSSKAKNDLIIRKD